jgi:CubicO group peptidase (beta-lactamase class C family)
MRVLLSLLVLAPALSTAPRSPSVSRAPAPDSLADRLRRDVTPWLDAQAKSGAFSGVVLVARNGVPIYSAAYGMADRARRVPNAIDTRFNLGSMNKMWTAIAIAQLVDQGKIDLDATVGRYVPDLPNKAIRETVKVRHLLSHTSGMGSYFRNGFLRNKTYAASAADLVPFYADDSLSFTPGARMQYSNSGFALLGLIIERVSGQSFYDYMQKNILDRAGMKRASYVDVRAHPTDIAIGYAKPEGSTGEAQPNWDQIEQHSSPAGGAFASASDLVAFSRALWSGKLASRAVVKDFTTGKVAMGPQMQYAFGFGVGDIMGARTVGHNGGIPGANAEFLMFPDKGIDVVVLANIDAPAATAALGHVISAVTGTTLRLETDNQPQIATVDVGPDGRERRGGNAPPGAMSAGPPPTLPPGMRTDRLPDTEQGRRVAAFLDAYSKGEGPSLAAFLEKYAVPRPDRTIEERVKGMNGMYDRTGKLTFKRLVGVNNEQIRFAVDSEKDGELTITMSFEPAAPRRVTLVNIEAGNRER